MAAQLGSGFDAKRVDGGELRYCQEVVRRGDDVARDGQFPIDVACPGFDPIVGKSGG